MSEAHLLMGWDGKAISASLKVLQKARPAECNAVSSETVRVVYYELWNMEKKKRSLCNSIHTSRVQYHEWGMVVGWWVG
jgi:hypothetical protein